MRLKRAQRLLVIAFAISLLIHLTFAVSVHPWRGREANEVEVVSIQHRLAMTRLQTPPPPPKATPVPHPTPAQRMRPRKAVAPSATGGGRGAPAATPAPVETSAPRATPTAGCEKSDIDAAITEDPPQPQIPNDARTDGTNGVASVNVHLDDHGDVTAANVSQSTGNSSLDVVALAMAREARYSPALHACKPVAANYTFRVRFYAW